MNARRFPVKAPPFWAVLLCVENHGKAQYTHKNVGMLVNQHTHVSKISVYYTDSGAEHLHESE